MKNNIILAFDALKISEWDMEPVRRDVKPEPVKNPPLTDKNNERKPLREKM